MPKKTKFYSKTYRHAGGIIRKYLSAFQAEINLPGRRIRKSFKVLEDAKVWIEQKKIEIQNNGLKALVLSDQQKMDAAEAVELLQGVSLVQSARFWLAHNRPAGGKRPIDEVFYEYLDVKNKANLRPRSVSSIRGNVGRFVQSFSNRDIRSIRSHDIEGWLDSRNYKGVTRGNQIRYLHGFFEFAVRRGAAESNPAEKLERPQRDERLPEIFLVADVEKIMRSAKVLCPDMVPFLSIGFFAGLRTAELDRLDWKNVDIDSRLITVRPETAKRRRQRHVDISENLACLLADCVKDEGRVCPADATRKRRLRAVLADCGVKWVHNGMRHSFASYYLAKQQDAARTALQLGHMSPTIVFDHYRNLVKPANAERYWSVV